jgi:hypothetical protein
VCSFDRTTVGIVALADKIASLQIETARTKKNILFLLIKLLKLFSAYYYVLFLRKLVHIPTNGHGHVALPYHTGNVMSLLIIVRIPLKHVVEM